MNFTVNFPIDYQFNPEIDHRMTRPFVSPHTLVEEWDCRDMSKVEKAAESLLTLRYEGTKKEPTL